MHTNYMYCAYKKVLKILIEIFNNIYILYFFFRFDLQKKTIDNLELNVPSPISTFLKQVPQSEFLECNYARAKAFYLRYPKDISEDAVHFQRKARQLISTAKKVLDSLNMRFWISSGVTLGICMSLFSGVTSYYVIDQSLLCIYDMKKMLGGEAKHNPHDSTYIVMLINYLISINKG